MQLDNNTQNDGHNERTLFLNKSINCCETLIINVSTRSVIFFKLFERLNNNFQTDFA